MHIAFVLPDLRGGGAQKMIINLANEFAGRGNQVDLIIFEKAGSYDHLVKEGVHLVHFNKKRSIAAVFSLCTYLKNSKPKVMISALFHVNLITMLAKLFSFSKETKFIITERNHLTLRLSDVSALKASLLKFLVQILYPYADKIIGISNGVCDDLKNILPKKNYHKIQTIYNPVITEDFERKIEDKTSDPFEGKEGLRLITSGRLVTQKDYPTLLRAVALYNQKYGPAYLVVLGDGPQKKALINLSSELKIKDNITFKGFVENPLSYMKYADIFVISSAWEGFCNVIVEALYAGLKVVATDCPSGPSEILDGGKYGDLSPVGDIQSFADNINKSALRQVSPEDQKNRSLEFTVVKTADAFEKLF